MQGKISNASANNRKWYSGIAALLAVLFLLASPVVFAVDGDNNGMDDAWEEEFFGGAADPAQDPDNDGLTNLQEYQLFENNGWKVDPTKADTDGDSLKDGKEIELGTNPTSTDTDGDGLLDNEEVSSGTDPTNKDTDDDGLLDNEEVSFGTDPTNPDTDDDGVTDKVEIVFGSSPVHPMSIIVDHSNNDQKETRNWDVIEAEMGSAEDPDAYRRNFISTEPEPISVDLSTIQAGGKKLPKGARFAVGVADFDAVNNLRSGGFTVEMWLKATDDVTAQSGTIFEVKGDAGMGYRLCLDNGSPKGVIYNTSTDVAIITVGGKQSTPALASGAWTHLALVWHPEDSTLYLYRDKMAIIGSFPTIYEINLGKDATATFYPMDNLMMDEFRFWDVPRSDEELEYWADRIIAAPLYTEALPIINTSKMAREYPLKAYYRFDDGGTMIEDFAHFSETAYMLTGFADMVSGVDNGAKSFHGTDDVDGDGVPEWWVYLHNLDTFKRIEDKNQSTRERMGFSLVTSDFYWSDDGTTITALKDGIMQDVGYTAIAGSADGTISGVGEDGSYTADNNVLSWDYPYVRMHKYINVTGTPSKAILKWVAMGGASMTSVVINQKNVGTLSNGMDVAQYLKNGRNQIIVYFTRSSDNSVTLEIPTQADATQTVDYAHIIYTGSMDVELTVDNNPLIVFGNDNAYDPRSVWYYRGRTLALQAGDTPNDLRDANGFVLGGDTISGGTNTYAYNYGMMEDADKDGMNAYYEYLLNTNPTSRDSDNNGIFDGEEDFDEDGVTNAYELTNGTDPLSVDTDNDGIQDGEELGVADGNPTDPNKPLTSRYIKFDTTDAKVQLPQQSRFALSGDWTAEAKIRIHDSAQTGTILARVLGLLSNGTTIYNYRLWLNQGVLSITVTDRNGTPETCEVSSALDIDVWTRVTVTYTSASKTMKLYIDGAEVNSKTLTRQPQQSGPGIVTTTLGGDDFVGDMDDVRIWSVTRTTAQIKAALDSDLDGNEDGLAAYYRFDDMNMNGRDANSKYYRYGADSYVGSQKDWQNSWLNAAILNEDVSVHAYDDDVTPVTADDTDKDGIPDWWEMKYFGDLTHAGIGDVDGYTDCDQDGLNDYYEYLAGTDPTDLENGTDDADADLDNDGLTNLMEQIYGSHPKKADTDDDGENDGEEVDALTSPLHSMNNVRYAGLSLDAPSAGTLAVPMTSTERQQAMGNCTVEAWVKPNGNGERIIAKREVTVKVDLGNNRVTNVKRTVFELGLLDTGAPYVACAVGNTLKELAFADALPANEWSHVAFVWNNSTKILGLLVNGTSLKEMDFNKISGKPFFGDVGSDTTMTVADGIWQSGELIDELRIWNIARSYADIADEKDVLVQADADGLVRNFRFDDGGATIEDFAHPGWANAETYALKPTSSDWSASDYVPVYGMDDANKNGMPDWFEAFYGVEDAAEDDDQDGLTNLYEYLSGTSPIDEENGNYDDAAPDGDGRLTLGEKQYYGLDPRLADSDGDGVADYDEIVGTDNTFKPADASAFATDPLAPLAKNNLKASPAAIEFTGNANGIILPEHSKYALTSWTIMAMVKPTAAGASTIISRQVSYGEFNYGLELDNEMMPYAEVGDEVIKNESKEAVLPLNVWTHLAATYDDESGAFALYVNGIPTASTTLKNMTVPCYGDDAGYRAVTAVGADFTGQMENIAFYGYAMDAETVEAMVGAATPAIEGKVSAYGTSSRGYRSTYATPDELVAFSHVSGQLIVKFKEAASDEMIAKVVSMTGAKVVEKLDLTGAYVMQLPANANMAKAIGVIRGTCTTDELLYCVPNYSMKSYVQPNDEKYSSLWGMEKINAPQVWDKITDASSVTVAVIDTGVDYTHVDLNDNMWVNKLELNGVAGVDDDGNGFVDDIYGYDFVNNDSDPMADDNPDYHGTHCAGTIAAVGNNGIGVAGVCWKANVMALKFLAADGGGYDSDAIKAIDYAVKMGAKVLSNSWGGYGYDDALYDAIARCRDAGILFVAAAGNESNNNEGPNSAYPASYDLDNILAVAASDSNDQLASFSNYGATTVDVAAPGVGIVSCMNDNAYQSLNGTSMATPHVAGMAALLLARSNGSATYKAIKKAIMDGADRVGALDGACLTGARVNLANSLAIIDSAASGASFSACGSDGTWLYDLAEAEFGSTAYGLYGQAPAAGRYAADLANAGCSIVELDAEDDINAFCGDSDGDGMPDWYEMAMGHAVLAADGNVDEDGDGLTNYFEFLAGTSPWNATSDGRNFDADLLNSTLGITYLKCQERGYDPMTGDTDNQDDDVLLDVADYYPASSTKPYVKRYLQVDEDGAAMTLPSQNRFAVDGDWAVEAWVNMPASKTTDATLIKRVVNAWNGSGEVTEYQIDLVHVTDGWRVQASQDAFYSQATLTEAKVKGNPPTAKMSVTSTKSFTNDAWNHIGVSKDASGISIYINGKLCGQVNAGTMVAADGFAGPVTFEAAIDFGGALIDNLCIWNKVPDFSEYDKDFGTPPLRLSGLVAAYLFDDGGVTAEDFTTSENWKRNWKEAAAVNATVASVGDSTVALEVRIDAYSGMTDQAYEDNDVLTAVIVTEGSEPSDGLIHYLYYWLIADDAKGYGGLTYDGTSLKDPSGLSLDDKVIVNSVDLALAETNLVAGDMLQLVVVPMSSVGTIGTPAYSQVMTVVPVDPVSGMLLAPDLTAINGSSSLCDQSGLKAGTALSVTVANQNDVAGTMHVKWFCNGVYAEVSQKDVAANGSVTLTLIGKDNVKEGDVWSFKVWFEAGTARSMSIPSIGTKSTPANAEWLYLMIGEAYNADDEKESGTVNLTRPTKVTIKPDHLVPGSTLYANVSPANPGKNLAYAYQWWYRSVNSDTDGWVKVAQQTLPYWQAGSGSSTVDDSVMNVTGFNDDDYNGIYYSLKSKGLDLWVNYIDDSDAYDTDKDTWLAVLGYSSSKKAWVITDVDVAMPYSLASLDLALCYSKNTSETPYASGGASLTWTASDGVTPPTAVPNTSSSGDTGQTAAGFTTYLLDAGDSLYVEVWTIDTYGNASSASAKSAVVYIGEDTASGDDGAYEPNDNWQDAQLINSKSSWMSTADAAIQTHTFVDVYDHDWVYFVVPDDGSGTKKLVSFETNAGTMFTRGVTKEEANWPNTALTVYRMKNGETGEKQEMFSVLNFSSNDNTGSDTEFARFYQKEFAPGVYYVDVWPEGADWDDVGATYYMHLMIEDKIGLEKPSWDAKDGSLSVTLSPAQPGAGEDLTTKLNCSAYDADGNKLTRFFYLWYRNGEIVPFNGVQQLEEYSAGSYLYRNAVEGMDTLPSAYTQNGDVWKCVVYAYDSSCGYTTGIESNAVIIGGSSAFKLTLTTHKTYKGSTPAVEYGTESVQLGWHANATYGFDIGLDVAAPSRTIPNGDATYSRVALAQGAIYSLGLSNSAPYLLNDYRPYNDASSWFVKVEMGLPEGDEISGFSMRWNASTLPADGAGILNITQMTQRADGYFEPIAGTMVTVSASSLSEKGYEGEITLNDVQMAALQTDAEGQKFAVYRVTVGTPSDMQTITLHKGWNLVALSVTPLNANVADVFSNGGIKYYSGSVWQYENGKYVEATALTAGRGYWLYSKVDCDTINVMGATQESALSLNAGWNIFGPIYQIDDFVGTYKSAYSEVFNQIEKIPGTNDLELYMFDEQTGGYKLATDADGKYKLVPGNGYWIKVKEAIQLPVVKPAEE